MTRAETLIHESRHQSGKPLDANFPSGSVFVSGKSGADSSQPCANNARERGNLVIDNAFATHPVFFI
jgi:hypothetical protein